MSDTKKRKETTQVNRKSLPERTADAIVNKLHMENYRAGVKLPNELQLAREFEVSRSTIRQAIQILREKKLLYTERGVGTFMAGCTDRLDNELDPLGLSLLYDKEKRAKDLLELRLLIEPRCALLAAQNAAKKDVELLLRICDEFDELVRKGESYVEKDMEFHQAIANLSGNQVIHNLIPYIHQFQVLTERISTDRRRGETALEHRRITEAIMERRGADAYDYMQYHLSLIRQRFQYQDR